MYDPIRGLPDGAKHALDASSVLVTLSALIHWLPAATTVITFLWAAVRLYETKTVQGLLGRLTDD